MVCMGDWSLVPCSLNNIGLWRKMEYFRRKATGAGSEAGLLHRREIMTQCVVNELRRMYPNPEGTSMGRLDSTLDINRAIRKYVGHQWGD